MLTARQYTEYLIATTGNYTCTNLADHLTGEAAISHDSVTDFLSREKLTPRRVWEVVAPLLHDGPASYLIVDDSVQNKQYSKCRRLPSASPLCSPVLAIRHDSGVSLRYTEGHLV